MELVNMTCRSCGGKLRIKKDCDQVLCQYCGTEYLVSFTESSISIKLLSEGIQKIQVSTDKTASELAIVRLQKEIIDSQNALSLVEQNLNPSGKYSHLFSDYLSNNMSFLEKLFSSKADFEQKARKMDTNQYKEMIRYFRHNKSDERIHEFLVEAREKVRLTDEILEKQRQLAHHKKNVSQI